MFKNVSYEAVLQINQNVKYAIPGQFIIMLGVVYILFDKMSQNILLGGFAIQIVLMMSRLFISKKCVKSKDKFLIFYFISLLLSGIAWGLLIYSLPPIAAEYHIMIFAILIGLVSASLFTLGEILPIYLAYIVPIFILTLGWFAAQDTNDIYTVTVYMGSFSFLYFISSAKRYSTSFNNVIVEKKSKENLLRELNDKSNTFELLFEHSIMGALIIEDGKFVQCNQKSVEMIGCSSKDELLHISPDKISPQYQSDGRLSSEKAKEMIQIALTKGSNDFEWLHQRMDGKLFLADVSLASIMLNGKKVLYTSWRDITEENNLKNNLKHLAHHDNLTNLPNRTLFNDRLEQAIIKSNRSKSELAVFFIDLDKFKPINDSLGHEIGDEVLIKVAKLLRASLRAEDTLARIGGDEFTIVMENFSNIEDVEMIANKLLKSLETPIMIGVHSLDLSLSIGISIYPKDADNAKMLLKLADKAMYSAKEDGRDNYKFYKKENS